MDNKRDLICRKTFFFFYNLRPLQSVTETDKECLTLAQPLNFHLKLCKCMCDYVCVYVYVAVYTLTCVCTVCLYISVCMCIIYVCM